MGEQKFRHEIKHFINTLDCCAIRNRLKQVMKPDPFALENNKYLIRSLYFDNLDNKALQEKINGVNNREKFRIRFYNHDPSFIRLEKKSKTNGLCQKKSVVISQEDCQKLLEGKTEWLRNSGHPLLMELYFKMTTQLLRPKTIVDYTRECYIFKTGNVRVTMDSDIRSGIFAKNLFDPELPTVSSLPGGIVVLEVKFDGFLPEVISDLLQTNERRSTAVSKYAVCRIYG